jgi:nucleoside phosphorylase
VSRAREIIMFDAEDPSTYTPHTIPMAQVMLASARAPIAWPSGKDPRPEPLTPAPAPTAPLPQFDYLVVTWTVEEAKCLADTLTPGIPSKTAWYPYAHKFESDFVPIIRRGAPSVQDSHRLGSYFPTRIAGKRVLCFKSELHLSQDGPKMPIAQLWKQLIAEVRPKLVITTGTAGGIGTGIELGDVVVAPSVRFDCQHTFKSAPFHNSVYPCSKLKTTSLAVAQKLFAANEGHLPPMRRPLRVFTQPIAGMSRTDVVTTDFFAFDDSTNHYKLQGLGAAVEMGDAVLGLVVQELGSKAPKWAAVRNASDPQIDATGLTPKEAANKAGQIYQRYGYWTTIPSAIACWALIIDN